jgi:tetratricopeptide (TPR) repeat protein
MAFFGYPAAHDNDAERAARAALAILDAIAKLNEDPARPKLSARIGIDSGAVVVGPGAGTETDVFGDAPNIAARVQATAEPGTILITGASHRLVAGLFVVEDCGPRILKGIEQPVLLYRVMHSGGIRGRLHAAAARELTPFVGREGELRLLMNRWEGVLDGEGQVVLIVGEAGIGKSRLVRQFHEQIAETPYTWVGVATAPFFQNTPFYPVAEMLRAMLARRGDESADEQLGQLERALELAGLKPAEAIPLLAPLLNVTIQAKYPPHLVTPEQQRRRLLATLVEWVLGVCRVQPLVIATEDLHWADPSTLELIQLLVEQGSMAPLMLLCTARPEFRPEWPARAHHTQINLNRLKAHNVRSMVENVAAQRALPEATIATVVERTGGVPLFVEELTRAVLDGGDTKPTVREIPVTLHDSLMARLDRLGPAKEVAQIGAVIGGEFSYELLHEVHLVPHANLEQMLRNLIDAELVYVRGVAPDATYRFKHALIRDAAYEALLKSRRKELHRMVARAINEKFPALKEAHPEVLARHWSEAGETEPAIAAWTKAGAGANAGNAFEEALENYKEAVGLLSRLPESRDRDLREFKLRQSTYWMLYLTRGLAAAETIEAIDRTAKLAEKIGNFPQLVSSTNARGFSAFFSGDLSGAIALADQVLVLALRESTPTMLANVNFLQLAARLYRGDFASAEKHFVAGKGFFDDPGFRQSGAAVPAFAAGSRNAWTLGRADIARERMAQMVAATNENNVQDMALSGLYSASIRAEMREYMEAEKLAASALELSDKHQLSMPGAWSRCVLGHARAQLGRASEGVALIRKGIAGLLEVNTRLSISVFTAYLAAALEREGAIAEALKTVEQGLLANPDELVYRPEALRLRGGLQLRLGDSKAGEADFREAVALAQRMEAKTFELRATMSLAGLLASQGRREEAQEMLAEIYGWFTEGFDTADLKDAKALLDELS